MTDHGGRDGQDAKTLAEIRDWLIATVAVRVNCDPRALDPRERFSRFGLDSLKAAGVTADLAAFIGRPLAATLLWDHPSIDAVVRYLTSETVPAPPPARAASAANRKEPIAVVGLACRFPSAPDPAAFWRLLVQGVDAIREVPPDRWDIDRYYSRDTSRPGTMNTRWGGFLDGIDAFDPQFFGISPREAAQMDPQQRIVLELAWEALEDAGIAPERLRNSATGVFVGAMWSDYARLIAGAPSSITQHTATGQDTSIIPARVSYTFGLQGPSLAVNTACSSSLVAVHLACQALRDGEAALALAGGVNLVLSPESTIAMSKFGAMSPDGRSRAFDGRANGYVRGEGAGLVVLKPLAAAIADGDAIYCVILAGAVNNDGFSNGLTAPNPRAQEEVLRLAYARAGVAPADVDYVETHGTGTLLGDPIEAGAIGAVLGGGRPAGRPLAIGSVKTNIGHLEAAAGIAGLIKIALAMRHGVIPRSLHFETANPNIDFDRLHLAVQAQTGTWSIPDRPVVAGISSFGFGGTNCHLVVQQRPVPSAELLALSAESPDRLAALARRVRDHAASPVDLQGLCAMAAHRLSDSPVRLALAVRSIEQLREQLDGWLADPTGTGAHVTGSSQAMPRLVWVCSGHGSQSAGMGRELFEREPVFRSALQACSDAIERQAGWSLVPELFTDEQSRVARVDIAQPAIFAIQVALAALWRSWGVEPDTIVGHSMGEVAAAHIAGILSLADAAKVICHRSRLLATIAGKGALAVVDLSGDETSALLQPYLASLSIAGFNSPESTLVSGEPAAFDAFRSELERRGVTSRLVRTDVAMHSAQTDPLCPALRESLLDVQPRRSGIRFASTVEGRIADGLRFDAEYWARNLRQPVRFVQVVEALLQEGPTTFLEVAPHAVLAHSIEQSIARRGGGGRVLAPNRRGDEPRLAMLDALGSLYVEGRSVAWERIVPAAGAGDTVLPEAFAEFQCAHNGGATVEPRPIVISAHSPEALRMRARSLATYLRDDRAASLHDLSHTLNVRRAAQAHRFATVARSSDALLDALDACAAAEPHPSVTIGEREVGGPGQVAFVFPAGASGLQELGRRLLAAEPVFRDAFHRCDGALVAAGGLSVEEELRSTDRPGANALGQPCVFVLQVALAALWQSWGLEPAAVIADGCGCIAASHVAGGRSLKDAAAEALGRGTAETGSTPIAIHAGDGSLGSSVITGLAQAGITTFIGISAQPELGVQVREALAGSRTKTLVVPAAADDPWTGMLRSAAALFAFGHEVNWDRLHGAEGHLLSLPPYTWLRQRCWLDLDAAPSTPAASAREARPRPDLDPCFYELEWRPHPLAADEGGSEGATWVVAADARGIGAALTSRLEAAGNRVFSIRYPASFAEQFAAIRGPIAGVVHLWTLDLDHTEPSLDGLDDAIGRSLSSAVDLVGAIDAAGSTPRVYFVTQGAQPAGARAVSAPSAAALWGLASSVAVERPHFRCVRIDLDPAADSNGQVDALARELRTGSADDLVAFSGSVRHVARLKRNVAAIDAASAAAVLADIYRDSPEPVLQLLGRVIGTDRPIAGIQAPELPDFGRGTCLITGGSGGLGMVTAQWLVERGARHIALLSRRPPSDAVAPLIGQMQQDGVVVTSVCADVGNESELAAALADIDRTMPPLIGVVHAAGALDDAVLPSLDRRRIGNAFHAKVRGAWLLHQLTADRRLEFFVMYSSALSFLGAGGQANYAAANASLDALAHYRRRLGLPATAINWGPWAEVGLAAARGDRGDRLASKGLTSVSPAEARDALDRLLKARATQAAVMHLDAAAWCAASPGVAGSTLFSALLAERGESLTPSANPDRALRDVLDAALPGDERRAVMESWLADQIASVLRLEPARLDRQTALRSFGLDSLMDVELRNRLEAATGAAMPATLIWNYPTIARLAPEIASLVGVAIESPLDPAGDDGADRAVSADLEALLGEIESMSSEEAIRSLAESRWDGVPDV